MIVELTCPYCRFSKEIPKEKIPKEVKWATCPRCHQRFKIPGFNPKSGPGTAESGEEKDYGGPGEGHGKDLNRHASPWENRSNLGLWQGIYQTLKAVLFSPEKLFRTLTYKGGIKEPLAFGLLVACIGAMVGFFWEFLILSGGLLSFAYPLFGQLTAALIFLIIIVIIPVLVTLVMFIYSGILHLLLRVLRAGQNGFEATFRVVSYSQAAQVWALIPFLGGLVAGIWQLIVQIIGLREIHETSYLRVIIAFMIPVALIFFLVIGVAIFLLL
ncbi:MAG: YIP1 family protein [Desulfobacterales bacterium]|nr:YIP1 family protein [Desulfobacterales bacterium]